VSLWVVVELLIGDPQAIEFEPLGASDCKIADDDAVDVSDGGALDDFPGELMHFPMLIEEYGFQGLPVFDVAAVEVVVFLLVFRGECGK
jgi:hypothetical protein